MLVRIALTCVSRDVGKWQSSPILIHLPLIKIFQQFLKTAGAERLVCQVEQALGHGEEGSTRNRVGRASCKPQCNRPPTPSARPSDPPACRRTRSDTT